MIELFYFINLCRCPYCKHQLNQTGPSASFDTIKYCPVCRFSTRLILAPNEQGVGRLTVQTQRGAL